MTRKPRRAAGPFRLETLEPRSLLSGTVAAGTGLESAAWTPRESHALLVGFAPGLTAGGAEAVASAVGGRVETYRADGPSLVALPPWVGESWAVNRLDATPGVRYAQANAAIHADDVTPNDPKYGSQWGLGFIEAPAAWGVTTGNPAVVVAVLDSGLDMADRDLSSKVWWNANTSGADGYRGDLHGWNFVNNTPNIQDNNGHGSHVSGVIAAAGNNGRGVTGIDWGARIMPVKVLDSHGNGTTADAISGLYFAVNHGAKVVNASWGGPEYSPAFIDALNYANAHGVLFVTAAGNDGVSNDNVPTFPASYRIPNELAVAALDQAGNLASFSNYGPHTVDVAAPGVNVLSTVLRGYASYTGTSMATPFVSGTAALVAGLYPYITASDLAARIRDTARPLPSLSGLVISGGVVDARNAVLNLTQAQAGVSARGSVTAASIASNAAPVVRSAAEAIPLPHVAFARNLTGRRHAFAVRRREAAARWAHRPHDLGAVEAARVGQARALAQATEKARTGAASKLRRDLVRAAAHHAPRAV